MKTRMLEERVKRRARSDKDAGYAAIYFPQDVLAIVRAELDRLARQVRKLKRDSLLAGDFNYAVDKVLVLIREAKR